MSSSAVLMCFIGPVALLVGRTSRIRHRRNAGCLHPLVIPLFQYRRLPSVVVAPVFSSLTTEGDRMAANVADLHCAVVVQTHAKSPVICRMRMLRLFSETIILGPNDEIHG